MTVKTKFLILSRHKLKLVITTVILAAFPVTLFLVQQRQELRKRAATFCVSMMPPPEGCYYIYPDGDTCKAPVKTVCPDRTDTTTTQAIPTPTPFIVDGPINTCGNGICEDVACLGIDCPEPETPKNCPQDCLTVCVYCSAPPLGCHYEGSIGCGKPGEVTCGKLVCPTPTPTSTPTPTPSLAPSPLTGNINQGRIVDVTDYSLFVSQFLHTGPGLAADFNQDNVVDVSDYSLLVANFLTTVP